MPEMSFTETIGFMGEVIEALKGQRAQLAAVGIDADKLIARIQGHKDRALDLDAKQESLKRETVATTRELGTVLRQGYVATSGALDTAIAAVGKTSDAAKNLGTIRSNVLRTKRGPKRKAAPPT